MVDKMLLGVFIGIPTAIGLLIFTMQTFLIDPIQAEIKQDNATYYKNFNGEKQAILGMDCKELHDSLLHDKINFTENEQMASDHYVAMCEGSK